MIVAYRHTHISLVRSRGVAAALDTATAGRGPMAHMHLTGPVAFVWYKTLLHQCTFVWVMWGWYLVGSAPTQCIRQECSNRTSVEQLWRTLGGWRTTPHTHSCMSLGTDIWMRHIWQCSDCRKLQNWVAQVLDGIYSNSCAEWDWDTWEYKCLALRRVGHTWFWICLSSRGMKHGQGIAQVKTRGRGFVQLQVGKTKHCMAGIPFVVTIIPDSQIMSTSFHLMFTTETISFKGPLLLSH